MNSSADTTGDKEKEVSERLSELGLEAKDQSQDKADEKTSESNDSQTGATAAGTATPNDSEDGNSKVSKFLLQFVSILDGLEWFDLHSLYLQNSES